MLYSENEQFDEFSVLSAVDGYVRGLGLKHGDVDGSAVVAVIRNMRQSFPAVGGVSKASGFKKAANFFCYFVAERPIKSPFPSTVVGTDLADIPNHQNVMTAWFVVCDCLEGSRIYRTSEDHIVLENRIKLSKHMYVDLVHACKNVTPISHFHIMSVFIEQCAYRFNPSASYELEI